MREWPWLLFVFLAAWPITVPLSVCYGFYRMGFREGRSKR